MGVAAGLGLDAVREALLAQATLEADQLAQRAAKRAAAQVQEAEDETAALVRHAREEGEAAAEVEAASELAQARRRARALVLAARRDVYDEVRGSAHAAVRELRSAPGYTELVERLASRAREELGPDAELELEPADGGVVARAGNRRLDYTLPVLVERCLAERAEEIERLWA